MTLTIAHLLEARLPNGMQSILERILGRTMPHADGTSRYGVVSSGRFRGAITADLLAFANNNKLDAALLFVDEDTERVLYFERGVLVGATSNVIFERIGRILMRAGGASPEAADALIGIEEEHGVEGLLDRMPAGSLTWAAEYRVWEIVAGLYLMHHGHYVLIEGKPHLHDALRCALDPMHVALEGMRRHDQWRNTPARAGEHHGTAAPLPPASPLRNGRHRSIATPPRRA